MKKIFFFPQFMATLCAGICFLFTSGTAAAQNDDPHTRPKGDLRVLYWNIQNGMWSDQGNNYDTFVEWVKQFDADICVWCEASSIYVTGTDTKTDERYLPDGWGELAQRYGHPYTAIGGFRDNYPQVITSKYPITTLLRITDTDIPGKPISHGAGVHQVMVNGVPVTFLTLHLWPSKQDYGVSATEKAASAEAREGDWYRAFEISYILDHTILSEEFRDVENWLIMGDFNSLSRADNAIYGYPETDSRFLAQDCLASKSKAKLVDLMLNWSEGVYEATWLSKSRIDYMYASPSMYERVTAASVVRDEWLEPVEVNISNFFNPSDHRPILVDFKF